MSNIKAERLSVREVLRTDENIEAWCNVLLQCRIDFEQGEDDWDEVKLVEARSRVPKEFHDMNVTKVKSIFVRLRRDKYVAKEHGAENCLERILKASRDFQKDRERGFRSHSEEYLEALRSPHWQNLIDGLVVKCENKCDGCGRHFPRNRLQGHHTPLGYKYLGREEEHHVSIVCEECHPIYDMIREGWHVKEESRILERYEDGLFCEVEILGSSSSV